jgi:hypothetical protein
MVPTKFTGKEIREDPIKEKEFSNMIDERIKLINKTKLA